MASWIALMRVMRRPAVVSHSPALHIQWELLAGTPGTLSPLETVLNLGEPTEGRCGLILMEHTASHSLTMKPGSVSPMISTAAEVHTAAAPTDLCAACGVNSSLLCRQCLLLTMRPKTDQT